MFTELYFFGIFARWALKQVLFALIGLLAFVMAVIEGRWDIVAIIGIPCAIGGFLGYSLWHLCHWLLMRNEPGEVTLEQECEHTQMVYELSKTNPSIRPCDVPYPPDRSKPVRVQPPAVRGSTLLEACELSGQRRFHHP